MTSAADREKHDRTKATVDGFIQGGFRARPVPPELPPITEVEFGSVYQDAESGTMWRAVPAGQGRWLQVELVTATEHAAVKTRRLMYLLVLLVAVVFAWLLLAGVLPLPPAPWSFLILFGFALILFGALTAWLNTAKTLATHLVAPAPGDI